jgi:hypothetical protein
MLPAPETCPALVLNADFRPLSYFPLSLWSWQDAVKAVFLDRVSVVAEYDRPIRSPSLTMKLPSVIALKEYVPADRLRVAPQRAALPAQLPARELARLSVLGYRARALIRALLINCHPEARPRDPAVLTLRS